MQRSGTETIRTQIQPSKLSRKITNITNVKIQREYMVNRVSSYFPKGGHSATETELKQYKHTYLVPRHRNSEQETENHNKTTALERSVMNYWGIKHVLRRQPRPQFLKWYKTFRWLFGSHDRFDLNTSSLQQFNNDTTSYHNINLG